MPTTPTTLHKPTVHVSANQAEQYTNLPKAPTMSYNSSLEPRAFPASYPVMKKRSRVQFSHASVVGTVTARSDFSTEERNHIWYESDELETFKNEARTLCRARRCPNSPPQQPESDSFSSRGLEARSSLKRQRSKGLALRCVLKAQARSRDPDFIARISQQCTQWASEVALVEGSKDFFQIYRPHMVALLPETADELPQHPLPITAAAKRKTVKPIVSDDEDDKSQGRNVRARLA